MIFTPFSTPSSFRPSSPATSLASFPATCSNCLVSFDHAVPPPLIPRCVVARSVNLLPPTRCFLIVHTATCDEAKKQTLDFVISLSLVFSLVWILFYWCGFLLKNPHQQPTPAGKHQIIHTPILDADGRLCLSADCNERRREGEFDIPIHPIPVVVAAFSSLDSEG